MFTFDGEPRRYIELSNQTIFNSPIFGDQSAQGILGGECLHFSRACLDTNFQKNTSASNIKDHQNLPIAISHPDFFYILTSLHTALGSASTRVSGPDSSSSLPPQESWPWAWTWMDAPASFAATSGLSRSVETAGGL